MLSDMIGRRTSMQWRMPARYSSRNASTQYARQTRSIAVKSDRQNFRPGVLYAAIQQDSQFELSIYEPHTDPVTCCNVRPYAVVVASCVVHYRMWIVCA